jgi:hypothetical protein
MGSEVEVAVVKGYEHCPARQRLFRPPGGKPLLKADAVLPSIAQVTELFLECLRRHPVARHGGRTSRRNAVVHVVDRYAETIGNDGLRNTAVPGVATVP